MFDACLLYPRKRTLVEHIGMSALCQKRDILRLRLLPKETRRITLGTLKTSGAISPERAILVSANGSTRYFAAAAMPGHSAICTRAIRTDLPFSGRNIDASPSLTSNQSLPSASRMFGLWVDFAAGPNSVHQRVCQALQFMARSTHRRRSTHSERTIHGINCSVDNMCG